LDLNIQEIPYPEALSQAKLDENRIQIRKIFKDIPIPSRGQTRHSGLNIHQGGGQRVPAHEMKTGGAPPRYAIKKDLGNAGWESRFSDDEFRS
jgi:hypothetical protein